MIEESVKIHDKFSLEIKLGFHARKKKEISEFACNTWFFIPNSLDINAATYQKADFYRDIKSNIRLITPLFLLRDIADRNIPPFSLLEQSFQEMASSPLRSKIAAYEYQIRMFLSILKSSLRNEINHILANKVPADTSYLIATFVENCEKISANYRSLRRVINVPTVSEEVMNYYFFGDEFISNLFEQHTFRFISDLAKAYLSDEVSVHQLRNLINREIEYKKENGYPIFLKNKTKHNRELFFRLGLLKKYAENELFLQVDKKRDGVLAEQVYFSLAAGLSMIFATAVAFSFQQHYGNLTMPLFVSLVISYMLKDRIKELARYYFAHKLGRRYFDRKTDIRLNENDIGWSKEAMDFIPESKVPFEAMKLRARSAILEANNRNNTEKIILYRKLLSLNRKNLDKGSRFSTAGVNEIIRISFIGFSPKMDDPVVPLFLPDTTKETEILKVEKIYYVNLILQLKCDDQFEYKRYRISINRKGIREVESFA
mgnify:CR=1 FL=1